VILETVGNQRPAVQYVPPLFHTSAGQDAIDLAAVAGLNLDDWQQYVLTESLKEREGDGKWTAFEVGLVVPRQNGKNALLEARELAGLFLLNEELIIHSAHEFKTAQEAFLNIKNRIFGVDELLEEVWGYNGDPEGQIAGIKTAHGSEGITLKGKGKKKGREGNRLRFAARSGGSGRGFSGNLIIFDEAYALKTAELAAMIPTMAAKSITGNPQLWFTSSTGMPDSDVLLNLRERALKAKNGQRLAYFEWSIPHYEDFYEGVALEDRKHKTEYDYMADRENWMTANPAAGTRIATEFIQSELDAMELDLEKFGRERLGILAKLGGVTELPEWAGGLDETSRPGANPVLVIDCTPSGDYACLGSASKNEDGQIHLELIEEGEGTEWLAPRIKKIKEKRDIAGVWAIEGSQAETLRERLKKEGVTLKSLPFKKYVRGCGQLVKALKEKTAVHPAQKHVDDAVKSVRRKPYGDSLFYWNRKANGGNISPIVAETAAFAVLQGRGTANNNTGKVLIL
jgi:phage terminase large subunit-like protein